MSKLINQLTGSSVCWLCLYGSFDLISRRETGVSVWDNVSDCRRSSIPAIGDNGPPSPNQLLPAQGQAHR